MLLNIGWKLKRKEKKISYKVLIRHLFKPKIITKGNIQHIKSNKQNLGCNLRLHFEQQDRLRKM